MVVTWRHSSHIGEQKNEMAVMLLHVGIKLFSNVKNFLCWVQFHYIDRIAHTFQVENFRLRSHPEVSGMLQSEFQGWKFSVSGFRITQHFLPRKPWFPPCNPSEIPLTHKTQSRSSVQGLIQFTFQNFKFHMSYKTNFSNNKFKEKCSKIM